MTTPNANWTPWGDLPADQNVIPFPRANLDRTPCDRGVNGLAMVIAEIQRQELRDQIIRAEMEEDRQRPPAMWLPVMILFAAFGAATVGVFVGRWAMEAVLGWGVW
jgi:hypothetical protein